MSLLVVRNRRLWIETFPVFLLLLKSFVTVVLKMTAERPESIQRRESASSAKDTDNLNTIIGSSNSPVVAGSGSISHISEAVCSVSNNIMGAGSNINGSPSSNITGSVAPTSTINNKISIGLGVTKN